MELLDLLLVKTVLKTLDQRSSTVVVTRLQAQTRPPPRGRDNGALREMGRPLGLTVIAAQQGTTGGHGEIAIARMSDRNATEMTCVRKGNLSLTGAHDTGNVAGMRDPRARGPRHVEMASNATGKGRLAMTIEIGKSEDG